MAARDKARKSTQEGADSLFLPTEQIKGIMQNKDKFVVTNLRSQHFYFMKKKLSDLSANNRNNSIIKRSQDNLNNKNIHKVTNNSSSNPNNSYLLLTSLISQKKAASLQHNQSQQGDISKYRLEPGGYCPSRSIEEMLDQVGYDIRSHECQPQITRSEQNALKKRTFFNCNRGMDLFEDSSPFQFSSAKYLVKHKKQGQYSRLVPADSQVLSSMNRSMEEIQTSKAFKNSQNIQPQPQNHQISQFSLPKQSISSLNINHNTYNINNNNNNSNHLPSLPIFKTKEFTQQSSGSLSHKRNRSTTKNERKSDQSSLLFTEGEDYFFENNPQAPASSSILADFAKGHQLPPISSNPITTQQHQHLQHYHNHQTTKLKH